MPEKLRILTIEPTVFFVRDGEALRQQVRVTVDNPGEAVAASLTVRSENIDVSLTLDRMGSERRCTRSTYRTCDRRPN